MTACKIFYSIELLYIRTPYSEIKDQFFWRLWSCIITDSTFDWLCHNWYLTFILDLEILDQHCHQCWKLNTSVNAFSSLKKTMWHSNLFPSTSPSISICGLASCDIMWHFMCSTDCFFSLSLTLSPSGVFPRTSSATWTTPRSLSSAPLWAGIFKSWDDLESRFGVQSLIPPSYTNSSREQHSTRTSSFGRPFETATG